MSFGKIFATSNGFNAEGSDASIGHLFVYINYHHHHHHHHAVITDSNKNNMLSRQIAYSEFLFLVYPLTKCRSTSK